MANVNNFSEGRQPFIITINSYSGDSSSVEFFFKQIKQVQNINNWPNEYAILFLQSKLTGAALRFFLENPIVRNSQDIELIEKHFVQFFGTVTSPQIALLELNNVKYSAGETIRNLAHRIDSLVHKIYTSITDHNSLETIKKTHFINSLPQDIKIKILQEKINGYTDIVDRAQELQNIEQCSAISIPNDNISDHNLQLTSLNEEIHALRQDINSLVRQPNPSNQNHNTRNRNESSNSSHNRQRNENFQHQYRNNQRWNSNRTSFRAGRSQPYYNQNNRITQSFNNSERQTQQCVFCGRNNHIMKHCREFKQAISNSSSQRSSFPSRQPSYSQLNANAPPINDRNLN
jgi:hypothetical protein